MVVSGSTGQARGVVSQSDRTLTAQVGIYYPNFQPWCWHCCLPVYGDGGVSTTGVVTVPLSLAPFMTKFPGVSTASSGAETGMVMVRTLVADCEDPKWIEPTE